MYFMLTARIGNILIKQGYSGNTSHKQALKEVRALYPNVTNVLIKDSEYPYNNYKGGKLCIS